jgi:hypothetical protein
MTSRTRGRLMICLILGLVALPVEALILPVALTPDPAEAAREFTAAMSPDELNAAAAEIDAYPAVYRRAIMQELSAEARADVWRARFQAYLESHRDLTATQAAIVREARDLVSPALFTASLDPETRERVGTAFNRTVAELGPKAASELFVTLGPKVLERPSALPLTQRLADQVRSWRTASAQSAPDCNCNRSMDVCDLVPDPWLVCSEAFDCNIDTTWPMCGPFWSWACTGWCRMTRFPGEGGEGSAGR